MGYFLTDIEKKALLELKESLFNTFPNQIRSFILFGGRARGERNIDSDIDVLAIFEKVTEKVKDKVYEIVSDLMIKYVPSSYISLKLMDYKHFSHLSKIGSLFLKNIKRDGIEI